MTCPRCSAELRPQRRENVEIDVCPQCRGIWLDSGELERLGAAEQSY
jgi:Zn-finger nucleic acid-binding protein